MIDFGIQAALPRRKDYRIGMLGSGFIVADCHLPAYRKVGFNPVAIASRNRSTAESVAQRHGISKVHDTLQDLVEDESIEVFDVATPPHAQLQWIRSICKKGSAKGILAQKPLGSNYQEAVEAVRLCRDAGITLAVNQNMRFDPAVRGAWNWMQQGGLGEPVFGTIIMRGIPHWMPWQQEQGWVTLRIMSIHHIDAFRYWFGDPQSIYASVRTDPRTKFPHQDGICTYILEYENGMRCVGVDDTWTGPAREGCPGEIGIEFRLEGLNGLAIGDLGWCQDPYTTPSTLKVASVGSKDFTQSDWTQSWFPDAFIGTMSQLLVALENGEEPAISGRDNLKTMALVEAAYQSVQEKRSVELNEIWDPSHALS